jgi:hypothetical protein
MVRSAATPRVSNHGKGTAKPKSLPNTIDARGYGSCVRSNDGGLAGAGGIEPPNGGIKIRCLTAWLRPTDEHGNAGGGRQITYIAKPLKAFEPRTAPVPAPI